MMTTKEMTDKITLLAHKPWVPYACLLLITVLAAALRFHKLGEWSFWIDEIFTLNRALGEYGNLGLLLDHIPPAGRSVPLSFILTAQALNLFGTSEWSARLVSTVIGVLTIPILFFPLRKIFDNPVTLIALLLLALSPWHIYWSQNARFYTSLLLLSTLALFAFYYALERDAPAFLLLFFALLYLARSERFTGLFIVPVVLAYVLCLWLLPFEKPQGLNRRNLLFLFAPFVLFALLEIGRFLLQGSSIAGSVFNTFSGQLNTTPLRLTLSIVFRISVPIFVLGLFGGIYALAAKQRAGLFVFIAATLPILMLVMLSMFMFTVDRYIFITLVPWLILCALAIKQLFSQAKKSALLLPLGVLMIFLLSSASDIYLYYQYQNGHRPDWRSAYTYIERNVRTGDIVFTNAYEVGNYYLPAANNSYINSFEPASLAHSEDRNYWFLIDESIGGVSPEIYAWIQDFSTLVRTEEVNLPGKSMSIRIYRYSTDPD